MMNDMDLNYHCTSCEKFGYLICGAAVQIGDEYFCRDEYGRYCKDYSNARCGAAKKRTKISGQVSLLIKEGTGMQELKPCPFCGGEAKIHNCGQFDNETLSIIFSGKYGVHCEECGIATPPIEGKLDAINAWNRRTEVAWMEYDREEIHTDCTVHVLYNSETGESSIGWWRNDKPPQVIGGKNDENGV